MMVRKLEFLKNKGFITLIVAICFICCAIAMVNYCVRSRSLTYYFLFNEEFTKHESDEVLLYVNYQQYIIENDTVSIAFDLIHIKGKDTVFKKPVEYLDNVAVFGKEWLLKEGNVSKFWDNHLDYRNDTLQIFLGEMTPKFDSVVFYKVRRSFIPYMY